MRISKLLVLLLNIFLSGCIALPQEHEVPLTPVLSGMVVDSETEKPIKNALVLIKDVFNKTGKSVAVYTDSEGSFALASVTVQKDWNIIWFIGPYTPGCGGELGVSFEGYSDHKEEIIYSGFCDQKRDKLVIKLVRI